MKKFFLIILFVLIIVGYFIFRKVDKDIYITEKISKGDITEIITATGVINPISTVNVGTQVSGTIKEIYVDYNSVVEEGQLLAIIDPAIFEAKVNQQKANLNSAKAQIDVYMSQLEYNKKNLERIKKLNQNKISSDKDFDIAKKEYDISKAQVSLQKANIEQIAAALKLSETEFSYTKIISPVKGIIVSKDIEVGQTVAASFQTPTLFKVAEDLAKMQISASVVETDVVKVKEGQIVHFNVDGFLDKKFFGKVIQVRNNPTTVQNVVSYEVIIEINNNELIFKPGMTANVEIITNKKNDILIVPNKALRFFISDETGVVKFKDRGIWVLNNDKPERVSVSIGISDDDNTEIITGDKRIKEGENVIIEKQDKDSKKSNKNMGMRGPRM